MPGTRKLGRPTAHRNSMLRGMVTYLLENGTIETTVYRAKEVRSMTEKMITLGKKNTLASRRAALSYRALQPGRPGMPLYRSHPSPGPTAPAG